MTNLPPLRNRRDESARLAPWQNKLHEIIFEADTPAGRAFDVGLFILIGISIAAVMLESVISEDGRWRAWLPALMAIEWTLTIVFTVEYVLRILCVGRPWNYICSFFGIIDLLSIVPTYYSLVNPRSTSLVVIRALRLLRVFRVLKLAQFLTEARVLMHVLKRTRAKIMVFLLAVSILVLILGSVMYVIEGATNEQFTSIPKGVYWAIVTVTTVGYGDIAPTTPWGQAVAALAMILGYSIIVVPTGFTLAEVMASGQNPLVSTQACPSCSREGHAVDAAFCKYCGSRL